MAHTPRSDHPIRDLAGRLFPTLRRTAVDAAPADTDERPIERPLGSDHTPMGAPARSTQGYGTSQGASGASSGGADPGGSINTR